MVELKEESGLQFTKSAFRRMVYVREVLLRLPRILIAFVSLDQQRGVEGTFAIANADCAKRLSCSKA